MASSDTDSMALSLPATLRLPHPFLTTYRIREMDSSEAPTRYGTTLLQVQHEPRRMGSTCTHTQNDAKPPPQQLRSNVIFTNPRQDQPHDQLPPDSNNFFWGRVRRAPKSDWSWSDIQRPTVAQAWLICYALFSLRPELEYFRVQLVGVGSQHLREELKHVGLAVEHPLHENHELPATPAGPGAFPSEIVLLRGNFWQGAGCPFGPRSVWAPATSTVSGQSLDQYPVLPLDYVADSKFPEQRVHSFHPRRPAKPAPGSIIYSRYIPHLDEHFSMIALDYNDPEHLGLFNKWQNDPFVAAGWNETGALEQHRQYLKNLHEDGHTMTVLAKFDDVFFAYYEIYWGKEDHFGVYCDAGDFDRGRHALVGNTSFRGKHRVSAWWSNTIHYLFLDEPRTQWVIGEPKATNSTVLSYDLMCGFNVTKFVDLTHKRSGAMKVSRERFFQISPLHFDGETNVGGTGIKLFAKL